MLECNPLNVLAQSEQGETMTKDEALKLGLEALEGFIPYLPLKDEAQCNRYDKAIAAVKETLAQPENEPVAWISVLGIDLIGQKFTDVRVSLTKTDVASIPLYTHPVKDLEDIVINITWNENSMRDFGKDELNFARAILTKAQNK